MRVPVDFVCPGNGARGRMWLAIPIWPREIEHVRRWFSRVNDGLDVVVYDLNGDEIR